MRAYYFATEDRRLRFNDNRHIIIGETHSVSLEKHKLELCRHGLHASERIIDALQYAPGPILYIVELSGEMQYNMDKVCAEHRTYLQELDCTTILQEFAKRQALVTIELIPPYINKKEKDIILKFLKDKEPSENTIDIIGNIIDNAITKADKEWLGKSTYKHAWRASNASEVIRTIVRIYKSCTLIQNNIIQRMYDILNSTIRAQTSYDNTVNKANKMLEDMINKELQNANNTH